MIVPAIAGGAQRRGGAGAAVTAERLI